MKKGFTLVELLAVVVLLAIVSLIATPIIGNVIETSRESANQRSIEGYADAVRNEYYNQQTGGGIPVIDSEFLANIDTEGNEISCENVLYSTEYQVILNKCTIADYTEKLYCYADGRHFDCDDSEFLSILQNSGGSSEIPEEPEGNLISTLLSQYSPDNATGLVQDETNSNIYYYKGTNEEVSNNYLWYGGHHWRVIEFDTDANTLLLISQQHLTSIQPASAVWDIQEEYESSYINTWLNEYFYNSLDSSVQNSIISNTFNVGIYTDVDKITTIQKVGLLDEDQYTRAGGQDSYLDIKDLYWLGNRYDSSSVRYVYFDGSLYSDSPKEPNGVRAVIKISDITIAGGNGTLESNYETGKKATNTSDIQVGEYINVPYSGSDNACGDDNKCTFRVVSKDSDSIKVVLNGLLPTTSQYGDTTTITTSHTIYTPLNTFANNISSDYRYTGNKTFYIGDYPIGSETGQNYTDVQDETLSANVGLPTVGEMFSGNDIDLSTSSTKTFVNASAIENPTVSDYYWAMNRRGSGNMLYFTSAGSLDGNYGPTSTLGVRPVIYLKSGTSALTFTGGKGTAEQPYELQ